MAQAQVGSVLVAGDAAASDQFGSSVAFNAARTIMAVGARNGNAQKGKVYIYDLVSGAWTQRGSPLTAADGATYDSFGDSVSLSADGAILAVGAPGWEGAATDQGGVYIFDWTTVWTQRGTVLTASDAAASDAFGTSVSLSADGAILAVGAPTWEDTVTDQGGVYIFDWTTVWTQRGSVITAADAAGAWYFGSGLSLSDTGAVLVVGSKRWTGAGGALQGAVYTYDWTTVWTQRGSTLTAVDAGPYDGFGNRISISGNGSALSVSADRWKNNDYKGHVYLYDVAGSAWTSREHFSAVDSVTGDGFGSGLDISDDGTSIVIGALAWEGTATDQGGVYFFNDPASSSIAPTKLYVVYPDFATAPTSLTVEQTSGAGSAPTSLTMLASSGGSICVTSLTMTASTGTPTGYTSLDVVWPTSSSSAPTQLTVTAAAAALAATQLAVLSATSTPNWTARCAIDGVDVSAQLTGEASVDAEEGAARIASIMLEPPSGAIAPLDYVGKTITLDYVLSVGGAEISRRLFTGRIDTPSYDTDAALLNLECVDDLQNRVAALDRSVLDTLIGGRYAVAVQGENLDTWDYAQARLSTVAASLDAGASGDIRVTPWEIASMSRSYGDADLLYQRSRLTLPQRSSLVNKVTASFEYRYPRLRQRYTSIGWSGSVIGGQMAAAGYAYPTQQDILSAGGGSGWTVTLGVFSNAPATIPHSSGGYIRTQPGAVDRAVLYMTQRHSQGVTETYTLTVSAPESVSANGELAQAIRGALASSFDGGAWESALDVAPLMASGGDMDWAPDALRTDADYAINTLLDQCRVKILGSHRSARVTNAVLCDPDLDLTLRVQIATASIAASGKVARVAHRLDFMAGSAISEFDIACFGIGGAGIITPDTLAPPAPPAPAAATQDWASETASLQVSVYGSTPYTDALMGLLANPPQTLTVIDVPTVDGPKTQSLPNPYYAAGAYPETGFRVGMPGVIDADRNPIEKPVTSSYQIVIPSDPLTLTVP